MLYIGRQPRVREDAETNTIHDCFPPDDQSLKRFRGGLADAAARIRMSLDTIDQSRKLIERIDKLLAQVVVIGDRRD